MNTHGAYKVIQSVDNTSRERRSLEEDIQESNIGYLAALGTALSEQPPFPDTSSLSPCNTAHLGSLLKVDPA